ncbi:unnamed protein product [Phytomonas sp. Hart1]|nr:unnamed protein product [Phytomonas sp. Hart1]|eukprot:CCW70414.1 unnamed protein product [Phytomonas sp. isolate Hart1]
MCSNFERLVLGDNSGALQRKSPFTITNTTTGRKDEAVEIPSFLQDFHDVPSPSSTSTIAAGNAILPWMATCTEPTNTSAADDADQSQFYSYRQTFQPEALASSSAERLHFTTASGLTWDLKRVKILGKGSYGCATLYTQEQPVSASSSSLQTSSPSLSGLPVGTSSLVVVKDINFQTMCNREEEMESLGSEVRVLRGAKGHPNCLQFLDYHEAQRMAYILTEYCGGRDLAFTLETLQQREGGGSSPHTTRRAGGPAHFTESFITSMLIQLSMGLTFLHSEQHVLHRDLKPQNLFLLEDGETLRLGDFGTAVRMEGGGGDPQRGLRIALLYGPGAPPRARVRRRRGYLVRRGLVVRADGPRTAFSGRHHAATVAENSTGLLYTAGEAGGAGGDLLPRTLRACAVDADGPTNGATDLPAYFTQRVRAAALG